MKAELIFIPAPGVGHLVSAVEVAKRLVHRDERISINILLLKSAGHPGFAAFADNLKNDAPDCVNFVDVPAPDESIMTELMSLPHNSFLDSFVSNQRTQVKNIVTTILNRSESTKLGGFVLDMFCTPMMEVAKDFDVPAYVFFTSGASFLGFIFYAQNLKDDKGVEISEFMDSDVELSVPAFSIPVPAKVMPSVMLSEGGSSRMTTVARRLRGARAILINTVLELETHAIKSLEDDENSPLIYHVGPIVNFESIWCGVPIAAWPIYAEQQTNAFQLVKELGLAVEIKLDYRKEHMTTEASVLVTAEEIERGIRCLMDENGELRKKVTTMKDLCRKAIVEGGSSYNSLGHFIKDVLDNIKQEE